MPGQIHDLSDFLNPMLIPRAPDGSIDPIVATIADTLYGVGPTIGSTSHLLQPPNGP